MSDQKPQYKTIKIVSKEEKKTKSGTNTRIFIIDQDGVKYVFNKFKADGNPTQAASQFKSMGLDEGMVTNIGFVTESYTIEGREITENKIIGMREDNTPVASIPVSASPTPSRSQSPVSVANRGHSDDFSRRLGVQGHINALLSNPSYLDSSTGEFSIRDLVAFAIEIEDEAEKQLNAGPGYKAWQQAAPKEDLPTIQVEDDVDDIASSIPF